MDNGERQRNETRDVEKEDPDPDLMRRARLLRSWGGRWNGAGQAGSWALGYRAA